MKNSTQITFAFQDPPDSGENPGVGVRIKSLKKAAKEVAKDVAEDVPEDVAEGVAKKDDSSVIAITDPVQQVEGRNQPPALATGEQVQHISPDDKPQVPRDDPEFREHSQKAQPGESQEVDTDDPASTAADHSLRKQLVEKEQAGEAQPLAGLTSETSDDPAFIETPTIAFATDEVLDLRSSSGTLETESSGSNNPIDPIDFEIVAEAAESSVKAVKSTRGRKSLKTIDEGADLINIPPDEILFQKQYYAIGEVAEMFHVNQSLLRFWETEFDIIQPRKNRKGDRHFRPVDIKNLLLIHDLLRRRKLTIEGAKDFLKKNKRSPERFAMIQSLQKIKGFILEIKATL